MKGTKKKVQITEQICRQAQLMRKGGANQLQVAELLGINGSTVSRIEAAGFDFKTYTENRKARREKEEARKRETDEPQAEEQVTGQIRMDLDYTKGVINPEMLPYEFDQTKLMRFQAGQVEKVIGQMMVNLDAILMKMDRLNDTMSMILRAVRKE